MSGPGIPQSNSNRLAGTAYLSVDGNAYQLRGDFEYDVSTVERETVTGMDDVHGYTEKPVGGSIKATLSDSGGLSVASLNAMTSVTVVAQLSNGKVVTGRQMWTTARVPAKATDATIEVVWEGLQGSVQEG